MRNLLSLYHEEDETVKVESRQRSSRFYDDDQKVKPFTSRHPPVMREIVEAADWTYTSRNPLIRFRRNYFWEDIALLVKRCTGLTIGVHKKLSAYRLNYRHDLRAMNGAASDQEEIPWQREPWDFPFAPDPIATTFSRSNRERER